MKRTLLILSMFFISCNLSSNKAEVQTPYPSESLAKYSYYITATLVKIESDSSPIELIPYNGTGFFYRKNGKIFFITAKHIASGCWSGKKITGIYNNSIFVWINDNLKLPINIKAVFDSTKCFVIKEIPDVVAIPVTGTEFSSVLSIESLAEDTSATPIKNIEIFGFGRKITLPDKMKNPYSEIQNISLKDNEYKIHSHFDPKTGVNDTCNLWIYTDRIRIDSTLNGFSGSPIIAKDSASGEWKLLGVFSSHTQTEVQDDKAMGYVMIKHLLREIDKTLRNPD